MAQRRRAHRGEPYPRLDRILPPRGGPCEARRPAPGLCLALVAMALAAPSFPQAAAAEAPRVAPPSLPGAAPGLLDAAPGSPGGASDLPGAAPSPPETPAFPALAAPIAAPQEDELKRPDPGLDVGALAGRILEQIERAEEGRMWVLLERLEALGLPAVEALRPRIARGGEQARLAAARATLIAAEGSEEHAGARAEAEAALKDFAAGAESTGIQVAAIQTLGSHGDPDAALEVLSPLLATVRRPEVLIPLARTLWELDHVAEARDKLVALLASRDAEVRNEAALSLAEMDYFDGDVRAILRKLRDEPTPNGRRANALELVYKLSRQLDRAIEGGAALDGADPAKLLELKEGRIRELEARLERAARGQAAALREPIDQVFEEVVRMVQRSYVDPAKTSRKELVLDGIKGLVASLDDFSSFMDVDTAKSFLQTMSGEYQGIGAHVQKPEGGPLEILRPIYGGPAYKAGILSGDRVLEVDGVRTDDLSLEMVTQRLKGLEGSRVTLKIYRRGWSDPRTFDVERRLVEVPTVRHEMLPSSLGYVQIFQFGEKTTSEFVAALDELEKSGMTGLILDLRNNPGGYLEEAIKVVDQFIADDSLPIVTQRGRAEDHDEASTYAEPSARPSYPMAVLINSRSASAAEIVSGALKDFGRAFVVGTRSYGKGSVQRVLPLSEAARDTLGGDARLRLTVQYYFLPRGKCIHTIRDKEGVVIEQGGVEPDLVAPEDRIPAWRAEEMERLRSLAATLEYVDSHLPELRRLYLEGDNHSADGYPELAKLHGAVESTAPIDDLRRVVRFHVRRKIEDERGREIACEFDEDTQLATALLEVLKQTGKAPEDVPRYDALARRLRTMEESGEAGASSTGGAE